jgi:hypothetical protein
VEFTTEDYGGARLVVPDEPNVFQLVKADSARYDSDNRSTILILWEMAKALIEEWECEALPELDQDLSKITDPRAARVIEWAGVTVSAYRRSLDAIPKNS